MTSSSWTVYVLRCKNRALYTGITKDLSRRIEQHNAGTGAKYTRANGPCELVWTKPGLTESEAKTLEAKIKQLPKREKEQLIV